MVSPPITLAALLEGASDTYDKPFTSIAFCNFPINVDLPVPPRPSILIDLFPPIIISTKGSKLSSTQS